MRDVGDVHLQVPAAVGAVLDVNGVVEIARGFAVNGDDGEVAKIFAAVAFALAHGCGALFRFVQDFGGKRMRQVVLADDDFDVDAEIARAAENFDDAPGGCCATARKAHELHVHDGAVEFFQARDASSAGCWFHRRR